MNEGTRGPDRVPPGAIVALVVVLFGCSVYVNLSFAVTDPADYRYFPPFLPRVNANGNGHLGAEYFHIARALRAGDGFANAFGEPTGPTAWLPPLYPALLAGLLWACDDERDAIMAVVVFLQVGVLAWTGYLVMALARRTTARVGAWATGVVFVLGVLCNFHRWFQFTHDSWLVLLGLDLLVVGGCRGPLGSKRLAAVWGLIGGVGALIGPVVGFTWAVLSLRLGLRQRAWAHLFLAAACAGLLVAPWAARNYLTLGRWIPVKSNAAYELYQSQCLQPDGLIQRLTFLRHPGRPKTREGREYRALGEAAYLDRKRQQFLQAVRADPADFLDRVGGRVLGALVWYVPFDREGEPLRSWALRVGRLTHPLPFLAAVALILSLAWRPLRAEQGLVVVMYFFYLLPYVAMSYYERYAAPLLGVNVLLIVWAADRCWLALLSVRKRVHSRQSP